MGTHTHTHVKLIEIKVVVVENICNLVQKYSGVEQIHYMHHNNVKMMGKRRLFKGLTFSITHFERNVAYVYV